jgi:glutamine synthetase
MREERDKNVKKDQPIKKSNIKKLPEDLKEMLDEVEREEKKKKK